MTKTKKQSTAEEQIRRSWQDEKPSLSMRRASERAGISERELRRMLDDGRIYGSQNRPGVQGSTIKISKASLVDFLVRTIR